MKEISYLGPLRRIWVASVLLALVPGCAVVPGAAGSVSGALDGDSVLALAADDDTGGAHRAMIRRALVEHLTGRGIAIEPGAAMKLHFGVAVRDPAIGFSSDGVSADDRPVTTGSASAYRSPGLSLCREEAVRLSIAIFRPGASQPALTGVSEDVICGPLGSAKAALLVDRALQPLRAR